MTATLTPTRDDTDLAPNRSPAVGWAAGFGFARPFLTFELGGEAFGIDLGQVTDVRAFEPPACPAPVAGGGVDHGPGATPDAVHAVLGMVQRPGGAVPVVDLRRHFALPDRPVDRHTATLELSLDRQAVAVVVDRVSEVVSLTPRPCPAAPLARPGLDARHVQGVGGTAPREVTLVDLDAVLRERLPWLFAR